MIAKQTTIDYACDDANEMFWIHLSVSYTMEEYHPQTWEEPASGGGPVDVSFVLNAITLSNRRDQPEVPKSKLSPRWVALTEAWVSRQYESSDGFFDRVNDAIMREESDRIDDW